jgi:hypothetical protein
MDTEAIETVAIHSSPYWSGTELTYYAYDPYHIPHQQPFQAHPMDLIVPMTALNTPDGLRSLSSVVSTVYQSGEDKSWTPFSRGWTAPVSIYDPFPVGWDSIFYNDPPQISDPLRINRSRDFMIANGIRPVHQYFNCLRYDFGQGNFRCPNVLGISGDAGGYHLLTDAVLYGSQDDIDVPQNWEPLLTGFEVGFQATVTGGRWDYGRMAYNAFTNRKSYRHFMVDIVTLPLTSNLIPNVYSARIEVMELLAVPIDNLVVRRDRPFLVINQNGELNPQWSSGEYPKGIRFDNAQYDGISIWFDNPAYDGINMRIGQETFDVYEVSTGTRMPRGEKLKVDGTTQYRMSDDSPYPGFTFTLSSTTLQTDSAELYISPGMDVFEVRLDDDDTWKFSGESCPLSDTMVDQGTLSLQIRANPVSGANFEIDGAVEGLLQICGEDDVGDTYLTSIPLSVVVSRQFSPLNFRANFVENTVRDTLYEFWITEIS